jgi:hypothetical protein
MKPKIDGARDRAYRYLEELQQTADVRDFFNDIIIKRHGELRQQFHHDTAALSRLSDAIKLKSTSPNALYRGLFIQANSIFEIFVREFSSIVADNIASQASKYSQLPETFRHQHIALSGKILREINTGDLTLHRVNFKNLTSALGKCFSDAEDFSLASEVFTLKIGNITPERLKDLFEQLALPHPFKPGVGNNGAIQKVLAEKSKQTAANLAEKKLKEIVKKRNLLVHGDSDLAIERSDLNETFDFLKALISALGDLPGSSAKLP